MGILEVEPTTDAASIAAEIQANVILAPDLAETFRPAIL
jgi:hypothetical protein